jgi:hypothetical protein
LSLPPRESWEVWARRLHGVLLAAIILGIALWLVRIYGFSPLRFCDVIPAGAP